MVTRSISFAEGEFYHVYNRGVDKRTIYESPADYVRFQELLFLANAVESINLRNVKRTHAVVYEKPRMQEQVAVGAYCLMPNHFHILLTPLVESGVSTFMNKLSTGYSMYFNKKHDRSGALFESNFKAQHADSDEYLKYLFAYIHLNPVKLIQSDWKEKGIKDIERAFQYSLEYPYSSLMDHFGIVRPEGGILNRDPFPDYFTNHLALKTELFDWLTFDQG